MRFAEISAHLRTTSDRYGGIKDMLDAAGQLDKALSAFFTEQTTESMTALNSATANAWRQYKQAAPSDVQTGPVAK